MTDPSTDPVGTVRREEHEGGYSIWQRHQPDATRGNEWTCVWSTARGNIECTAPHPAVADFPVIGAVPGTPAAEQHDEAAIEKAARAMFADDLRRGSDAGVPPWTPDRVEEHWTRFLLPERRDRYVSNARAALAALRGEKPVTDDDTAELADAALTVRVGDCHDFDCRNDRSDDSPYCQPHTQIAQLLVERDTYRANGKEAAKIAFGVSEKLAGVEAELAETKAAHRAALLGMTPSGKPTYEALEEHVADLVQENGVLRGDLDEAQRSATFWQSQAESWEREHQNTVLPYTSQIEDERDEAHDSRLQWAAEAIDAEARTDYVRWLHAEQAWYLELAKEERLRLVAELEKATTALTDVMAERGEAARSARDSAVYAEQGWTETERLRARVADLEGQLAHAVSLRSDPASEAFRVRLEDDEPTPSDLRVAPSLGATPTEPGPDARVWARGAPQPDSVTHILERGERHWCLNRTDNVWYMRDIAGPTLSWDDLLEGCGWVVEVVATDVQ